MHNKKMSAHLLLISANQVVTPYPVYPLGAAYLLGALKEQGHTVDHFDLLAGGGKEALFRHIAGQQYDLVGISIRNLDSVDSAAPDDYLDDIEELVASLRKKIVAPIVLGGAAFSIMPEQLLAFLDADYGIVGEGEQLFPWLATELVAGRGPKERLFYSGQQETVWKDAEFSSSIARYYVKHGGMLNVQTKRGCPHRCSYCSYPTIEGKIVRYREPQQVAEEVNMLRDKYGAKYIFFTDSYFNDHKGHYLEIAEALVKNDNTLPWCAFFRPDSIQRSELKLLKRAGLAAIEMGTDAVTDETLSGIGKTFTFSRVVELHQKVIEEEIPCAHYVMFGGPGENRETLEQGLENLDVLKGSVIFAFAGIRILPDTRIYDQAIADNVIARDESLIKPRFYFSPQITQEEIVSKIEAAFAGKIERVYPCHEFEQRVEMLHQMGHVGPLWDLILKMK